METNKAQASDYGIHPTMPIIPDTMVAVAEYARKLMLEDTFHTVQTGERIPNGVRFIRIATEMGLDDPTDRGAEFVRNMASNGEAIIWDRELHNMTDDERTNYLRPFVDPTYDPNQDLTDEQIQLADEFTEALKQAFQQVQDQEAEINKLRKMFGED